MKASFSMEMADLKKHVAFVKNAIGSSKTDLSVLLMKFELAGPKLTMFTADKEMFCRTEARVSPDQEDGTVTFAVMGSKIESLITQVDVERVAFVLDDENLEVKAHFLTVNFELFDAGTLKMVEQGVADCLTLPGVAIKREILEEALVCAKSCTSESSIKPDVNHAEIRDGRGLSSDGRKIMIYSGPEVPEKLKLKVPGSALCSVTSSLRHMEAEVCEVAEGKSYYYLRGGKSNQVVGVRKVERSFPPVEAQVTNIGDPEDVLSIDKNMLEAMLKGVALGLPSEEVKVTLEAAGTHPQGYLEVASRNNVGRKSFERANVGRKSTASISVPVSFRHLLETLSVFKGDSVVDMHLVMSKNVLLVRDTTPTREVMTVIPFRTEKQIADESKEKEAAKKAAKKEEKDLSTAAAAAPAA